MSPSTKTYLLMAYAVAILITVFLWDERRRGVIFKAFMSEYQFAFNMAIFRFAAPISLVVFGAYLISLFIK